MATLLPHPQHLECMLAVWGKELTKIEIANFSGCWPRRCSGARRRQAGGGDGDDLGQPASDPGRRSTQK
jgi:hypothetical protein